MRSKSLTTSALVQGENAKEDEFFMPRQVHGIDQLKNEVAFANADESISFFGKHRRVGANQRPIGRQFAQKFEIYKD